MPKKQGTLTGGQKAFSEAYVNCYNAVQAYHIAYPNASHATAKAAASRLLKNPDVLAYVEKLQKEQWRAACVNAERIGSQLAAIAFNENGDVTYKDQMKALELLQKQLGLLSQKLEVKQEVIEIGIEGIDNGI